ncbi:hypothetical protein FQN55_005273 [Onygenales sp. PD_40]|nr:hypothetical protein FQN55_005273 [Onygenales sp. PD_40]
MALPPSLQSWSLPRLSALLPLDEPSLLQLLTYTISLPRDEAAEHLKNILGDSARALEFIVGFNERRGAGDGSGGSGGVKQGKGKGKGKDNGKNNVRGDTQQQQQQPPSASGPLISDYLPNVRAKAARAGKRAAHHQQQQHTASSPSPSRTRNSGSNTPTTPTTTTTTNNIADLTSAIALLELSTNPSLSSTSTSTSTSPNPRKCNCAATLHPLFTPAPNCLSCGKIICALEGLQPCSFCHTPLLSARDVQEMIRELRAERGNEKMRAHNTSTSKHTHTHTHTQHTPFEPPPSSSSSSVDRNAGSTSNTRTTTLAAATAHRDKLLAFQAQNARRTRVVDEVAEFETPDVHGVTTLWMSAGQRALALKRQQRVAREMEERNRPEWERGGMVVSLSVDGRSGRVVRRFERAGAGRGVGKREGEREGEGEEEEEEEGGEDVGVEGGREGAFGNNPLLAGGGLVRPVWKGDRDKDGAVTRKREQRQAWRRVQDDNNEDNERWILDGGLYGHGPRRGQGYGEGDVEGDGNFCG